jgi:raffinose/stachyose/melibiose transport system substrate-binding protein
MRFSNLGQRSLALVALATASTLFAAGCSAGSLGSSSGNQSGSAGASTTITLLTDNGDATTKSAQALVDAFRAANPISPSSWIRGPVAPTVTTW